MALRKIIEVDEEKCDGCALCVSTCAEGALAIVNGKAKVVRDDFCDGFGDCLGDCPREALKIVEKDTDEFDPKAVQKHVLKTRGAEGLQHFLQAHERHEQNQPKDMGGACPSAATPTAGGCPGSRMRQQTAKDNDVPVGAHGNLPAQVIPSELRQWPIQLHLVQAHAPFFQNKELVLLSTCSPISSADTHWRFIRGRAVVVACPKLDRTEGYIEKLAQIIGHNNTKKLLVVRMEVPCCGGLTRLAREAVRISGNTQIELEEFVVNLNGDIV